MEGREGKGRKGKEGNKGKGEHTPKIIFFAMALMDSLGLGLCLVFYEITDVLDGVYKMS